MRFLEQHRALIGCRQSGARLATGCEHRDVLGQLAARLDDGETCHIVRHDPDGDTRTVLCGRYDEFGSVRDGYGVAVDGRVDARLRSRHGTHDWLDDPRVHRQVNRAYTVQ